MKTIYILKTLLLSVFFTNTAIIKPQVQVVPPPPALIHENSVAQVEASNVVINPPSTNATPTHITIENAHVDASIVPVGVTNTNNLDVPPNFVQAGWYEYGPRPGEQGSVVIDGHVDNGSTIDGVFKHLRDLRNGDDIYVSMDDGRTVHYKVTAMNVYATNAFPSATVFDQTGEAYLKIITCHGTYVPALKTYDERLVVTALLQNN